MIKIERKAIPHFVYGFAKSITKMTVTTCPYCGKPVMANEKMNLCHIISNKNGGEEVASNLVVGHASCNKKAGAQNIVFEEGVNKSKMVFLDRYLNDNWEFIM